MLFLLFLGAVGVYYAIFFFGLIKRNFEQAPEDRHWDRYDAIYWSPVLWMLWMMAC